MRGGVHKFCNNQDIRRTTNAHVGVQMALADRKFLSTLGGLVLWRIDTILLAPADTQNFLDIGKSLFSTSTAHIVQFMK